MTTEVGGSGIRTHEVLLVAGLMIAMTDLLSIGVG